MKIASWYPLDLATLTGVIALLLYLYGKAPRFFGVLATATVAFAAAGLGLIALAHHPLNSGLGLLILIAGVFGAPAAFWLIMIKGHHKRPLLKRKGQGAAGAAGGTGGSGKGAHHRAMGATVLAAVFLFLGVANWHAIAHAGRGGISQTYAQIAHL